MNELTAFQDLMQRVRAGDADAAVELVHRYEPEIRRILRVRMTDGLLRRTLDSADICQSVLANFFVHASQGEYQLEKPEDLVKLLAVMARNRLRDHVRRQHAGRRDVRRAASGHDGAFLELADREPTPSQIVAGKELLQLVRNRLTAEERYLAEQRASGRDWVDLAAELGVEKNALRMRLRRGLERAMQETDSAA